MDNFVRRLIAAFSFAATISLIIFIFRSTWFKNWLKKHHKPSFEELEAADRIAKNTFQKQDDLKSLLLKPDAILIGISFFAFFGLALFAWSIFYITGGLLGYVVLVLSIVFLGFLLRHHILHMPLQIELSPAFIKIKTLWPWFSFTVNVPSIKEVTFSWFEVTGWQPKKYDCIAILSDENNKYYFSLSVLSATNKEKLISYFGNLKNRGLKVIYIKSPWWSQWF